LTFRYKEIIILSERLVNRAHIEIKARDYGEDARLYDVGLYRRVPIVPGQMKEEYNEQGAGT